MWKQLVLGQWGLGYFLIDVIAVPALAGFRTVLVGVFSVGGMVSGDLVATLLKVESTGGVRSIARALGLAAGVVFVWLAYLTRVLLLPPFPPCRQGKCRSIYDYKWAPGDLFGRTCWRSYTHTCECGDDYVREGIRYGLVVRPGPEGLIHGSYVRPYMKLIRLRRWVPDDGEAWIVGAKPLPVDDPASRQACEPINNSPKTEESSANSARGEINGP